MADALFFGFVGVACASAFVLLATSIWGILTHADGERIQRWVCVPAACVGGVCVIGMYGALIWKISGGL